jgi:apolipoprotein N-acyltransferase
VVESLPRHQQEVLAGRFDYLAGQTFYHEDGDVFAWLCLLITLAIVATVALRGGSSGQNLNA